MIKPLTLIQQCHLIVLNERVRTAENLAQMAVNTAKAAVNDFIEYLADEHSAPPSAGWVLRDLSVGFEQPSAAPQGKENA